VFLRKLDVGLTDKPRERCDAMIIHGEAKAVLWKMSPGKSPGADGSPAEFWRFFWNDVVGDFMKVVDWVRTTGCLTDSMSWAVIHLLFKKGNAWISGTIVR
jgi:hypothetical protein